MTYSDQELQVFDREMESYKIAGKHTRQSILNFMHAKKVVNIYPKGRFAVVADYNQDKEAKTTVHSFKQLDDKISQWQMWRGRIEYAGRKQSEQLDVVAQRELLANAKTI
jgi:hypothetical protein